MRMYRAGPSDGPSDGPSNSELANHDHSWQQSATMRCQMKSIIVLVNNLRSIKVSTSLFVLNLH